MPDITQITGSDIIMFSAESNAADLWMRELYGRHKIYYNLPNQHADAIASKSAASAHGFSIVSLDRRGADGK